MKLLLFDQNISPHLVDRLADLYPGSIHVSTSELGLLKGFPPKIIWIRRGNCSTREIETMLRENYPTISALSEDSETGILTLF